MKSFNKVEQTCSLQPEKKVMKMNKKKKIKVKSTNAIISDFVQASGGTSATIGSTSASQISENGKEDSEHLPGFIFLCSGQTKPECYLYRVFGLPKAQLEVIEKIKPGTKLFLFDFNLKLLYGVYEAMSTGKMDLEPSAFGGKFPAQVNFGISKECLPLPEKSFKCAIKMNYKGSKFKPELSKSQVRDLISLFRPLHAPPSSAHLLSVLPNDSSRLVSHGDPYLGRREVVHAQTAMESLPKVQLLQPQWYETPAYISRAHPTVEHRSQPALTGPYNIPGPQKSYIGEGIGHCMTTVKRQLPAPAGPYYIQDYQQPYVAESLAQSMAVRDYRTLPTLGDPYHVQDSQQPNFNGRIAAGTTYGVHRSVSAVRDPYDVQVSQRAYFTSGLAHGMAHQSLTSQSDPYNVQDSHRAYFTDGLAHGIAHQSLTAPSDPYYVQDSQRACYTDGIVGETRHQSLTTPSGPSHVPDVQHPYPAKGLPQVIQEPNPSYTTVQGMIPHNQVVAFGSEDPQLHQQVEGPVRDPVASYSYRYDPYSMPTATYGMPAARYITPVVQPQGPAARGQEVNAPVSYYYSFAGATLNR